MRHIPLFSPVLPLCLLYMAEIYFVAFTVRGPLLRVISARDMNKREREAYADREKEGRA